MSVCRSGLAQLSHTWSAHTHTPVTNSPNTTHTSAPAPTTTPPPSSLSSGWGQRATGPAHTGVLLSVLSVRLSSRRGGRGAGAGIQPSTRGSGVKIFTRTSGWKQTWPPNTWLQALGRRQPDQQPDMFQVLVRKLMTVLFLQTHGMVRSNKKYKYYTCVRYLKCTT